MFLSKITNHTQSLQYRFPQLTLNSILTVFSCFLFFAFVSNRRTEVAINSLYLMEKAAIYVEDIPQFEEKVRDVASRLNVPPEWLMAVMYSESRFDAAALNMKGSGATGLIQFMPPTAVELGTSCWKLRTMPHHEQLEYVYAYMNQKRQLYGEYNSITDFYLAILYPKAINQEPCYVLYSKPSKMYKQNIGLDINKDGYVTISEIDKRLSSTFPLAYIAKKEVKN